MNFALTVPPPTQPSLTRSLPLPRTIPSLYVKWIDGRYYEHGFVHVNCDTGKRQQFTLHSRFSFSFHHRHATSLGEVKGCCDSQVQSHCDPFHLDPDQMAVWTTRIHLWRQIWCQEEHSGILSTLSWGHARVSHDIEDAARVHKTVGPIQLLEHGSLSNFRLETNNNPSRC